MLEAIIPIYIIMSASLIIILLIANYKEFKKNDGLNAKVSRLTSELDAQREDADNCEKIVKANREIIDTLYLQNKELKRILNDDAEILPDSTTQASLFDIVKH